MLAYKIISCCGLWTGGSCVAWSFAIAIHHPWSQSFICDAVAGAKSGMQGVFVWPPWPFIISTVWINKICKCCKRKLASKHLFLSAYAKSTSIQKSRLPKGTMAAMAAVQSRKATFLHLGEAFVSSLPCILLWKAEVFFAQAGKRKGLFPWVSTLRANSVAGQTEGKHPEKHSHLECFSSSWTLSALPAWKIVSNKTTAASKPTKPRDLWSQPPHATTHQVTKN